MARAGGAGPKKPWCKWSADTERAFLAALKLTGQVSKAAAEIGRSRSSCQSRRRTHAEFAKRWDETLAEQQADWIAATAKRLGPADDSEEDGAGGGRLTPWRDKAGGWDSRKRGLFLRTLKRTKRVDDACAAAGMSNSAAYYLRGQSPRFAAAWEKALRGDAPPSVLEAALERAVTGWTEPIVAGGKVIGERRRYSDSLLRALVQREADAEKSGAPAPEVKPGRSRKARVARARAAAEAAGGYFAEGFPAPEETDAVLMAKLAAIERRRADGAAEAQARDWARWRECWGALGWAARSPGAIEAREAVAGVWPAA